MKLLGLRLDAHDANVTYYDGETVRYRSFERDYQCKHVGFEDGIYEWTRIFKTYFAFKKNSSKRKLCKKIGKTI